MAGKLTVNMTVNGVGYYRHEVGHPVIKTMEVSMCVHTLVSQCASKFRAGAKIRSETLNRGAQNMTRSQHQITPVLRLKALQTSAYASRT